MDTMIRPEATTRRVVAEPAAGAVVVHQLDADGVCWREYALHPGDDNEAEAVYERITRGFRMASTMVTRDGRHQMGAVGAHAVQADTA